MQASLAMDHKRNASLSWQDKLRQLLTSRLRSPAGTQCTLLPDLRPALIQRLRPADAATLARLRPLWAAHGQPLAEAAKEQPLVEVRTGNRAHLYAGLQCLLPVCYSYTCWQFCKQIRSMNIAVTTSLPACTQPAPPPHPHMLHPLRASRSAWTATRMPPRMPSLPAGCWGNTAFRPPPPSSAPRPCKQW